MAWHTCDWCHIPIDTPAHFNRNKQRLYCSDYCFWMDWMFRKWQSDENIEMWTKKFKEEKDGKNS